MARLQPEPWLRGAPQSDRPEIAQILFSFTQAIEDIEHFTEGFSDAEIWMRPHGLGAVGFHIRHIVGSIDRLLTYAEGRELTPEQLASLRLEHEGETSVEMLRKGLGDAALRVKAFRADEFGETRTVGRQKLPTTVIGLLIHIAEHTQRHTGQAVLVAQVVRDLRGRGRTAPS